MKKHLLVSILLLITCATFAQTKAKPKGKQTTQSEMLIGDVREALKTSGLQTAIINGLEGIRTMKSFDRGLFD